MNRRSAEAGGLRLSPLRRLAPYVAALAWVGACLAVASQSEDRVVSRLHEAAVEAALHAAENKSQELDQRFAVHRAVVRTAADHRDVLALLGDLSRRDVGVESPENRRIWVEASTRLATLADATGVSTIFLADRNGDVRAHSGRATPESYVRLEITFRDYFRRALDGGYGEQLAISQIDDAPGYFFSAPVRIGDAVVGIVATRLDLSGQFSEAQLARGGFLLHDQHGVVVFSPDEVTPAPCRAYGRALSLAEDEMVSRYGSRQVPRCTLVGEEGSGPASLPERFPVSVEVGETGLTLRYATDDSGRTPMVREHRMLWVVLSGLGVIAIALSFRVVRHLGDLRRRATTDALTGLGNRAHTVDLVSPMLGDAERDTHRHVVAMLVDIDHFKSVNDTFGHAVGDAVLRRFAALLNETRRRGDVVGRWGGEEFVVVGHVDDPRDALAFGERLRTAVEGATFGDGVRGPARCTVSIGIALHAAGDDLDSLLREADAALYEAKEAGRNQVRMAPPPSPMPREKPGPAASTEATGPAT